MRNIQNYKVMLCRMGRKMELGLLVLYLTLKNHRTHVSIVLVTNSIWLIVEDSSGELEVADELVLAEQEPQPRVIVSSHNALANQMNSGSRLGI